MYLECIKECYDSKELSPSQKKGLIRISYKKNGRIHIENYRPITLLNVDLKILTRTLAKRMAKVLPRLIHDNQKCVPGRNITTNIHIVQDLIDAINSGRDGAALIFLDQEKAFDRMSHEFIFKTLEKFGFGNKFIEWIKIIYSDMISSVKVNGFLTAEFIIKRGVRQGCPLSALIYVLCAEVLGIEIRANKKITGFKYNNGANEHKVAQYADDMNVCVTNRESIIELFKVLEKFGEATNARVNKGKTEGLLVGSWRDTTDHLLDIKWTTDKVKFLGVYVGNDRNECSRVGFEEIKEKIRSKMSYWKGRYVSLKGRVKILNIFILSKLWYVLESQDMPSSLIKEINRMITNFVWNDIHQTELTALHEQYTFGGLNLQDIEVKMKALRVKWIRELVNKNKEMIERFLCDYLIGKHGKFYGLKIINYDKKYDNNIKNDFYKSAVKVWKQMFYMYKPPSVNEIRRDWIYDNILLQDDDGRIFKPPSYIPPYAPEFIYDLPVTDNPREFKGIFKKLIPKLNKAFMKIKYSEKVKNEYTIQKGLDDWDIQNCKFKDIYNYFLEQRKEPTKLWKQKWGLELEIDDEEWPFIWENVHHKSLNYKIQSSVWEMLHRNFMCSYFAKIAFHKSGECKLCKKEQTSRTHIFMNCCVIDGCLSNFSTLLNQVFEQDFCDLEKAFGLKIDKQRKGNDILRNYITFSIRHVIYRSRNNDYGGLHQTITALVNKVKIYIKGDLKEKYNVAYLTQTLQNFTETFLKEGILGKIQNGNLVFCSSLD